MVGHDLYLLQCPPVCGAGFGYDVATCYFDFPGKNLAPVFGTENDVIAKFIDLVTISLHVHKTYVSIRSMSTTKSKTAQRRESIVNAIPQRTLVLSLDITPEQYGIFDGLADSYNRMWGSLVSWCNNNRSINRTRMQKDNGVRTVMVDPAYTSQKCNRCGYVDARNRDHARFDCLRCGHSDNADHNAALNIRDRAIQNLG